MFSCDIVALCISEYSMKHLSFSTFQLNMDLTYQTVFTFYLSWSNHYTSAVSPTCSFLHSLFFFIIYFKYYTMFRWHRCTISCMLIVLLFYYIWGINLFVFQFMTFKFFFISFCLWSLKIDKICRCSCIGILASLARFLKNILKSEGMK